MVFLEQSVPPEAAARLQQWTLTDYGDVRLLREEMRIAISRYLRPDHQGSDDWLGYVAVIATELVTNGLMHGGAPVTAELLRAGSSFVLVVADGDPSTVPAIPEEERPPGAGGLGLQLVRDLADQVGWYVRGCRKHVWARLLIPA